MNTGSQNPINQKIIRRMLLANQSYLTVQKYCLKVQPSG